MINFATSLAFFVLYRIVAKVMKLCNCGLNIFGSVYKYFSSSSYWWCLFISCIETNISVLTFFSAVQLNYFVSLEFFDHTSLLVGAILLFGTFLYSFVVYTVIFSYYSKSKAGDLLGLSKYS